MGIFNLHLPLEDDAIRPRPPPGLGNSVAPQVPGGPAIQPPFVQPGNPHRVMRFEDLMHYPGPPQLQAPVPPEMDWRALAGVNRPVPENRVPAQGQRIAQAAAVREATLQQVRAEIRQPPFMVPGVVPRPPARDNQAVAGGDAPALNTAREAAARRLRIEGFGAELQEVDPAKDVRAQLARLREVSKNNMNANEEIRRRTHEQMNRFQVLQNAARAIGRQEDENLNQLNERLERLRQQVDNDQKGANREVPDFNELPRRPSILRFRRRQPDPPAPALPQPAEALRQQQILDHAERALERSQQMARLRRDGELDVAVTARNLRVIRQNNAPAVAASRQAQEPIILLSSSPEQAKKKATMFDLADEADDEGEDLEDDEDWL
jgi:hypothetical protein